MYSPTAVAAVSLGTAETIEFEYSKGVVCLFQDPLVSHLVGLTFLDCVLAGEMIKDPSRGEKP